MAEWVKLTELGDRKCDAVRFDRDTYKGDGNFCFSREMDTIEPEGSWLAGFRFDLAGYNVVDYNLNGGYDIVYGQRQEDGSNFYYGSEIEQGNYNGKEYYITFPDNYIQWEWTEPLYYYGYNDFSSFVPNDLENQIEARLYEGGEVEPDEPDTPVEPDEPTIESHLARIIRAKAEIKAAIESKGVTVDEGTIDTYASKIYEISQSGGSCKIESRWFDFEDLDNGNCWWYASDNDLDGFSFISVNASNYGNQKYQEGYDQGKSEGGGESINPLAEGMKFAYYSNSELPEWANLPQDATDMSSMFYTSNLSDISKLSEWDVSNVYLTSSMFFGCDKLTDVTPIANWNTSKFSSLSYFFYNCGKLTDVTPLNNWDVSSVRNISQPFGGTKIIEPPSWDTSKWTSFQGFLYECNTIQRVPKYNAGYLTSNPMIFGYGFSDRTILTEFGGLEGLKYSSDDSYTFVKCPNLSYESCINILNGLYDFAGNGKTPTSLQGKLKVHQNFLDLVGDEISIGINKGWTITA